MVLANTELVSFWSVCKFTHAEQSDTVSDRLVFLESYSVRRWLDL